MKLALLSILLAQHANAQGILDSLFAEPTISSLASVLATATDSSVQTSLSSRIASLVNVGLSSASGQFESETLASGGEPLDLTASSTPSMGFIEPTATTGVSIEPTNGLTSPTNLGSPIPPTTISSSIPTDMNSLSHALGVSSATTVDNTEAPSSFASLAEPVFTSMDASNPTPLQTYQTLQGPSSSIPTDMNSLSHALGVSSATTVDNTEAPSSFASLAEPVFTSIDASNPTPLQTYQTLQGPSSSAGIADNTQSSASVQPSLIPEVIAPSETLVTTSTVLALLTSGSEPLFTGSNSLLLNGFSTPAQVSSDVSTLASDATVALATPQVTDEPAIPEAVAAIIAGGHLSEYIQSFLDNPGVKSLSGLWQSISDLSLRAQISSDVGEIFQLYAQEATAKFVNMSSQPTGAFRQDTLVPLTPRHSGENTDHDSPPITGPSTGGIIFGNTGAAVEAGTPLVLTSASQGNSYPVAVLPHSGYPDGASSSNISPDNVSPNSVFPSNSPSGNAIVPHGGDGSSISLDPNGIDNGPRGIVSSVGNNTEFAGISSIAAISYVNSTAISAPTESGENQTQLTPAIATGIQGSTPGGTNGTMPPVFANTANQHSYVMVSLVISTLIALLVI